MAIDIETVRAQQRELNMVSDEVSLIKRRLKCHQELLDDSWKSAEIKGIDLAVEEIVRRLSRLAGDIEDLGHDVMLTGEEIKAEEKAAAAEEARRIAAAAEEARKAAEAAAAEKAIKLAVGKVLRRKN